MSTNTSNIANSHGMNRIDSYQAHARNANEQMEGILAANQQLHTHVEEVGEAYRQVREENDQLRALNRRAAVVLREESHASGGLIFSIALLAIVVIVATLFFTGCIPVWVLATVLALGAVSLLIYWGYEWYASAATEPPDTLGHSATPINTPGAENARNQWLHSLERAYV